MRLRDGHAAAKHPLPQVPSVRSEPGSQPKLPKLSELQPSSSHTVASPCSDRPLDCEQPLNPAKPFHILLTELVGRKLAGCLSSAVLRQTSQTAPEGGKENYYKCAHPRSLRNQPLAHRLSLRLLSRGFGRVFSAGRVHTLGIVKRCRYDHDVVPHRRLPEEARRWRELLPGVRRLRLEHLLTEEMAGLLRTATPYPSLRRLRLDGGMLLSGPCELGPAAYPSLRHLKWKASLRSLWYQEHLVHKATVGFVAQLLSALPEPDAMRHLHLKWHKKFADEALAQPLWEALGRFRRLRRFAGLRTDVDHFAILHASADSLVSLDAINCLFSLEAARFPRLRNLGLWDLGEFSGPRCALPFWPHDLVYEQRFDSAAVRKLLLRVDLYEAPIAWPVFEAFTGLRVLHLAVSPMEPDDEESLDFSWAFYSVVEEIPSLRVLLLGLPAEANEVRLSRLALETLGLAVCSAGQPTVHLRLGGVTERSLRKIIRDPSFDSFKSIVWGEARLPVEEAPPVTSGQLHLVEQSIYFPLQ